MSPVTAAPEASAGSSGYRCIVDVHGGTRAGRIKLRRVVNGRVQLTRTTARTYGWTPLSWGLVSQSRWPGREVSRYLVPSTDGRVRLVETEWRQATGGLRAGMVKVAGTGFPHRLVAAAGRQLYWLTGEGALQESTWNGRRFTRPRSLPVTIPGATAIAAHEGTNGFLVYVADRGGALRTVVDNGQPVARVLRSQGFANVTGLRVGECMSPDQVWIRSYTGLVSVRRKSGIAQFVRHLRPYASTGGSLTAAVRVPPSDWTWKSAG